MRWTPQEGLPASVVGRTIVLLGCFTADDIELSLGELARRSGIPKPTVHRLARELIQAGMLEVSPEGVRLGRRLFELGQIAPNQRLLREVASPFLHEFFLKTKATVHLAILVDADVLYLDKVAGREGVAIPSRVGGRLPAHCTALGKVLLAHSSEDAVRKVFSAQLARRTPRTVTAPGILNRQLHAARQNGYAVESEEARLGVRCVAAPIFHHDGRAIAAISIATPTNGAPVDDVSRPLIGAAQAISDRLHRAAHAKREAESRAPVGARAAHRFIRTAGT